MLNVQLIVKVFSMWDDMMIDKIQEDIDQVIHSMIRFHLLHENICLSFPEGLHYKWDSKESEMIYKRMKNLLQCLNNQKLAFDGK